MTEQRTIEAYDDPTQIYEDTVYLYDPEQNPAGASLPGIPLRNLRSADLEGLSEQQIRSLERTGWYKSRQEAASAAEPANYADPASLDAAPEEIPLEPPAEEERPAKRSFNRTRE